MGLDGERTGYLGKENMDERDGRKEEMCCTMPPVWRERDAQRLWVQIPFALLATKGRIYIYIYRLYSIHRLALMALYPVSFYGLAVAL